MLRKARIFATIVGSLAVLMTPPALVAGVNINVEAVRKSVVFLYGTDAAGNVDSTKPLGTGFLVQVPLLSDPKQSYILLVTARHIIDPQWAQCPISNPTKMYLRVNKRNFDPAKESIGTGDVALTVNTETWSTHPDGEVDAAVTVLNAPLFESYDFGAVRISDFPTPEELKTFTAGDAIVSAGLFPGASGRKRNYPIFKFGNISSIPDEPAESTCTPASHPHSVKVWFVAASLVPGNSGSPIFYMPSGFGGFTVGPNTRAMLLGVQSTAFLPWDVAGMTPIQYVYEIIQNMKLPDADLRRGVQPAQPPAEQKK